MPETEQAGADVQAAAGNGRFQVACIDLLCRQENTLSQLSEANTRRHSLDSLQLARQMLLQFLDFTEANFPPEDIDRIGRRLYAVHDGTREYEQLVESQSYGFLKRMVGMNVPTEDELNASHDKLRRDYVALYNDFFSECAKRFDTGDESRQQFLTSVANLLSELERKW